MLTAEDFRRIVLGLEGAIEGAHMGHPDFRVNNRIFASLHHEDRFGMVALKPEEQQNFIRAHPAAFTPESGAWGLQGCTRVHLDAAEEDALGEAITLAWRSAIAKGPTRPSRSAAKTAKARKSSRVPITASPRRSFKELVSDYPKDVQALARATRSLMKELLPKSRETVDPTGPYIQYGYGSGYEAVVGYITVNQKGVKLGVAGGASLPDPKRLLQGSGKSNRHVVIRTRDDLEAPGLRQLVRAALAAWRKKNAS